MAYYWKNLNFNFLVVLVNDSVIVPVLATGNINKLRINTGKSTDVGREPRRANLGYICESHRSWLMWFHSAVLSVVTSWKFYLIFYLLCRRPTQ